MKKRWIGVIGAVAVAASTLGVTAFADTSSSNSGTTQNGASQPSTAKHGNPYKNQLQAERKELQSLHTELKSLNEQLKSVVQEYRGKHVLKGHPAARASLQAAHREVVAARQKLKSDLQLAKADKAARNGAKLVVDLRSVETDVKTLIGVKQKLLTAVKNVASTSTDSSTGVDNKA